MPLPDRRGRLETLPGRPGPVQRQTRPDGDPDPPTREHPSPERRTDDEFPLLPPADPGENLLDATANRLDPTDPATG